MTAHEDEQADIATMALVAPTYRALADTVAALPAERWEEASTCEGWRVREVVAHLTMATRYDEAAFTAELAADGYDFGRLSDRLAAQDAELPVEDLVAGLRDERLHAFVPPGGSPLGALTHAVVHAADVTVPLGLARSSSDEAVLLVLDGLGPGGGHAHFGVDLDGLALEATDLAWSSGETTEPTRAPAAELVLLLTGRHLPAGG